MKKVWFLSSLLVLFAGTSVLLPSASVNAQPPDAIAQQSPSAPIVPQTQVELLNAGAAPRQQLRFSPQVNHQQTLKMTLNMDVKTLLNGQDSVPFTSPAMVMVVQTDVTKVDTNGDIHLNFVYTDAAAIPGSGTPPVAVNAIDTYLKTLVGLKQALVMDALGNAKQPLDFALPATLDPGSRQLLQQIADSFQQLTVPLPQGAVGIGAQWRATQSLNLNGIALTQTVLYEIVNLQGNAVTVKATVDQQAPPQELQLGQPADIAINLLQLASQGSSTFTFSLDRIVPDRAEATITTNTRMMARDETGHARSNQIETNAIIKMKLEPQ